MINALSQSDFCQTGLKEGSIASIKGLIDVQYAGRPAKRNPLSQKILVPLIDLGHWGGWPDDDFPFTLYIYGPPGYSLQPAKTQTYINVIIFK